MNWVNDVYLSPGTPKPMSSLHPGGIPTTGSVIRDKNVTRTGFDTAGEIPIKGVPKI